MEVSPSYPFYPEYMYLRTMIVNHASPDLDIVTGTTTHYNLPDFRLCWHNIRVIGLHPRPKGVELLLEYAKFMRHREDYNPDLIDQFEDACGAIIKNKNGLFKMSSLKKADHAYLETYISVGIKLYTEYLIRTHRTS